MQIPAKTLADLEFPVVLEQLAARCITEVGAQAASKIVPFNSEELIINSLGKAKEYLDSFELDTVIPNHGFEPIDNELKLLGIENTSLEVDGFRRISGICQTGSLHRKFFKKQKLIFPLWSEETATLEDAQPLVDEIKKIIDRFGEIRDDASPELKEIRKNIQSVRSKLNQSFASALSRYKAQDYLDDIRESTVDSKRVLAVKAMYRKKVKGSVMGASKTGSIVYIEPDEVMRHSRALNNLIFDEQEEIRRILKELTEYLRPFTSLLVQYVSFLTQMDICSAKAKYAKELNAILPEINDEKRLFLKNAYHPLLYLSNKQKKEKTWPQTLEFHQENRILVISGPNAGGKSITLKTIGLLQLMLQSGLLIPVHKDSSLCFFSNILSDIGDNQSIENHLSTYSYRLQNMKRFLQKCTRNTLFLIDEFGTGSDPELGGALAEACLEVFYDIGSYGVITTHYANLKLLADELPHATNANMLFNSHTLQPTFQLQTGQPGSSFTFEVAQQIGIPYSLINKAKKKIERGKVRFDATIAKMQKERNKMVRTGSQMQKEEAKAREESQKLNTLNAKLKAKLESYQELYDHNQRMILLGDKVDDIAAKYYKHKKKRQVVSELLHLIETENSKRAKKTKRPSQKKQLNKKEVANTIEKEIQVIRKQKVTAKPAKPKPKPRPVFKIGDRVRMLEGKAVGSIDSLEKNKAVVNYGRFTTNVSVDQLELVQRNR